MATAVLTQKQRFMRLYRNSLKLQFNWINNRQIWLEEAWKVRINNYQFQTKIL